MSQKIVEECVIELCAIAANPDLTDEQCERTVRTTVEKLREYARIQAGITDVVVVEPLGVRVESRQTLGVVGCADCGGEHEVSSSSGGLVMAFDQCPTLGNQEQKGNVPF